MKSKTYEEKVHETMRRCDHFTGLMNDVCKADVAYDDVKEIRSPKGTGINLPCICIIRDPDEVQLDNCPKRKLPTRVEAETMVKTEEKEFGDWMTAITENLCPTHRKPITKKQVGRCVYAVECGCRLYQGTLCQSQ